MNKKFSTLMAGLLLAGGALSSVSAATTLEEAAKTPGTYYKMLRIGQKQSGTSGSQFQRNTEGFSLEYIDGKIYIDNDAQNGVDYWKVSGTTADGFVLTNQNGESLTVKTQSVNQNGVVGEEYTNLAVDQWYVIKWETGDKTPYALIPVSGTEYNSHNYYYSAAFDAVATNLQEVAGLDATDFFAADGDTYVADGKTYRMYYTHPTMGNMMVTNILKANYDKKLKTWSFTYNENGNKKEFGNEVDFELVKVGDDLVMALPSGKGYVQCNGLENFTIVSSIEEATVFAFEATKERVPVSVAVLNYYEKDGFSVEITCDKDNDDEWDDTLAGDEFKGHLVPMAYDAANSKFVAADEYAKEYYLKNSDGKYIVAIPYNVETEQSRESLFHFTTVTEAELLHDLARSNNYQLADEQQYFGKFRASVDEAKLSQNAEGLDEITWLEVCVAYGDKTATYEYATVGRADINKVPTLVAACDWGTTLKDIHIKLGSGQVVDWKELLQPKFFTVEQYKADGTTLIGKLTASVYSDGNYNLVNQTSFVKNDPGNKLEGQFALTIKTYMDGNIERDYYVFSNRETPEAKWATIPVSALYYTNKDFTYKYGNNVYVIKPVEEVNEADGYARFSDSELNRQYHVAYSSNVYGTLAYLAENHDDAKDSQYHTVGLKTDKEEALVFNIKKYNAARNLKDEQDDHTYNYHPTDSIYVVSDLGFYNTKTKKYDTKQDTLKVVAYSFVNQFNEPLSYDMTNAATAEGWAYVSDVYANDSKKEKYSTVADAHKAALKFAVREDNGKYNLRPVHFCKEVFNEVEYGKTKDSDDLYQIFDSEKFNGGGYHTDFYKMYAGDATSGILTNTALYSRTENDLFVIEETESEVYRRLANNVDTVSIYRNYNEKSLLYEKTTEIADDVFVNFLGMENIADFTKMAPAMIADTAYVRNETYKPQYMLIVDPTIHPAGKWCEEHQSATCEHAVDVPAWTEGRILINLVDSAKAWDEANKHQVGNPYKNTEGYYKLGFVQATHRNDSLIVNGKRQFIGNNDNHIAKFQFRYADTEDKSFVIETSLDGTQTPGYLKWMNGVVVVVDDIKNADIYNMNEDEHRNPTANENIAAGNVVVAGVNGAVVVKGAEGKNVIVSTILGKVVANEVVSSDNATIAAPQGVVVVSVDGESFKVVVK